MSDKSSAGFTLLEVLVALAIAGLALIVLFRAGGEGLFAVDTASRAEEAVERAQSHLAAVGREAALLQGDFHGNDGGGYRWNLSIKPVARRQVTISWPGHGHDRAVVLRTERVVTAPDSLSTLR